MMKRCNGMHDVSNSAVGRVVAWAAVCIPARIVIIIALPFTATTATATTKLALEDEGEDHGNDNQHQQDDEVLFGRALLVLLRLQRQSKQGRHVREMACVHPRFVDGEDHALDPHSRESEPFSCVWNPRDGTHK